MFSDIKTSVEEKKKRLKRSFKILKLKCFFLFVLPVLLVVLIYQIVRQLLRLGYSSLLQRASKFHAEEPHAKEGKTLISDSK